MQLVYRYIIYILIYRYTVYRYIIGQLVYTYKIIYLHDKCYKDYK